MPGRTTAAKRYAEAVAAIARQENSWDQWRKDFDVLSETLSDPRLRVLLNGHSPHQLLKAIDTPLSQISIHTPTLEDAYLEIIGRH